MAKLRPAEIEAQLQGLNRAVSHATKLFQRGVISQDELHAVQTYALETRFGPLMSTEEYIQARKDGSFEKYETLMADSRTPGKEAREMAARKVAAAYVAEQALNHQPKDEAESNAVLKAAREKMSEFIDMSGADADDSFAIYETNAKLHLGDKVEKPVEVPSWAKPVQRISDEDADVKAFKLRDENTFGTERHGKAYGNDGVKRAADGRIIAKTTLREEADKPKAKKSEWDDTRGFVVDKEYGVRSAGEAAEIEAYEQGQRADAAAAAEAAPPPPSDPGPVTLPNPNEA